LVSYIHDACIKWFFIVVAIVPKETEGSVETQNVVKMFVEVEFGDYVNVDFVVVFVACHSNAVVDFIEFN
jgi:hypothetical protein